MSRIGKLPIKMPSGVTVTIQDRQVGVQGPKGKLQLTLPPGITVKVVDQSIQVAAGHPEVQAERAAWGLGRVLVANMVTGVTQGFSKRLEISGVGYRAAVSGQTLTLHLGFSHPVEFAIPPGISVNVEKNSIIISGIDKQLVGEVAAKIRSIRPPEPYKGKGVKYADEVVRRKAGKVVKAAGAK